MACQSQYAYAKLLRKEGLGDGLYYPTRIAKLGDVAYFSGTTYHTRFNVFTLDEEVLTFWSFPADCRQLLDWASDGFTWMTLAEKDINTTRFSPPPGLRSST